MVLASASFSFSPFVLFHGIGKAKRFFLSFSCVFYLNCKGNGRAFFLCAFTYFMEVPLLDRVMFERRSLISINLCNCENARLDVSGPQAPAQIPTVTYNYRSVES